MAKRGDTNDHYQAVILIALLINEMAMADGYESLHEVLTINPSHLDLYARYSEATLAGAEKYRQLSVGAKRQAEGALFFMSEAIAATDGTVPVTEKHIRYAKAAFAALQTYSDRTKKRANAKTGQKASHE